MSSIAQSQTRWTGYRTTMFEDVSDRLNHVWTFGLLLFFAFAISFRQTVTSPISCWLSNGTKEGNRQYVNDMCWNNHVINLQQKYDVSQKYSDVKSETEYVLIRASSSSVDDVANVTSTSTLYQWVPIILIFQALLFKLPHLLMYMFHGYSGLCYDKLSALTRGYDRLNIAERRVLGNQVGRYIYNWCDQFGHCIPWRLLTLVYIITKFLYCVNVIVQICLLDSFLKTPQTVNTNFTSFSDVIIDNVFRRDKTDWKSSPAFPRIVLCEYRSPIDDDSRNKAVYCFLSMNVHSEMVFIIVWVWFLFLSTVTCTSLVSCLVKISIGYFRKRYIMKCLALADNKEDPIIDHTDVAKFADWIGEDGIMALKLIGTNSSEILVSDVVCSIWKKRKRRKSSNKAGYIDMTSGSHSSPPRIKIHPVVTDMEN